MKNVNRGAHCLLPPEQVIRRIFASGKITTADRDCLLKAAIGETPLSPDLMDQVSKLFERLRMGLLKVVD
ncbi:MAG: hypothetical protein MUF49_26930 [Oculatellaceae cyanobacterium Prado106]|jgi:hypothetical protein|nr:hypothetical protein [Oculatellaceae cyanobacterium Prado106]